MTAPFAIEDVEAEANRLLQAVKRMLEPIPWIPDTRAFDPVPLPPALDVPWGVLTYAGYLGNPQPNAPHGPVHKVLRRGRPVDQVETSHWLFVVFRPHVHLEDALKATLAVHALALKLGAREGTIIAGRNTLAGPEVDGKQPGDAIGLTASGEPHAFSIFWNPFQAQP